MKKKQKEKKNKLKNNYDPVQFEIEEDAAELFRQHLDMFDPDEVLDSKKSLPPKRFQESHKSGSKNSRVRETHKIDLHGLTVQEAQSEVDRKINELARTHSGRFTLRIITGKGLHSPDGEGVLAREIWDYVHQRYQNSIESMDASPSDVKLAGRLVRGHFDVTFQKTTR